MSLQAVLDLLGKQKLVEGLTHAQTSTQQHVVEAIVQNQHTAELKTVLARQSEAEIGRILEGVPPADAQRLWPLIAEGRRNDILWEISPALGADLADGAEPFFVEGQITAFAEIEGRMRVLEIHRRSEFEAVNPMWIDILGASKSERSWIARHCGLELPDPDDMTDLEVSARFYEEENDEVHLHSNFLLSRDDGARAVPVAFIVHAGMLFTVRNTELPVFRLLRLRARNQQPGTVDCRDLLLELFGADVEYSADALEETYQTLRRVGQDVLNDHVSDTDAARILAVIGEQEDLNGLIRGNLLDTQRGLSFLIRGRFLSPTQAEDAKEVLRDIDSLNSHTTFLFEKINFLMDATIGFINVNQNRRVTQLTVVSVVFMPLNVLAGIGGMSEFSMMTQGIPWPIAYSVFSVSMLVVGWLTYQLLKRYEKPRGKGRSQG